MKKINWRIPFGIALVALSALIYGLHYVAFHDPHHILIYLLGDIAFVPIEVLMVTLILHQLLSAREKRAMLKKLNMVIGVFFSEVGRELLDTLKEFDPNSEATGQELVFRQNWSDRKFASAAVDFRGRELKLDASMGSLSELRDLLDAKRPMLLTLLENPNLLEHEDFTELLWAVFHLAEELSERKSFGDMPTPDRDHLSGDIHRVYGLLIAEWLVYLKHLRSDYPYLFSLAVRTNPFDENAKIEVE